MWLKAQLSAPAIVKRQVLPRVHDLKEIVRLVTNPFWVVQHLNGVGVGGPLTVTFVNVRFSESYLERILFVDEPQVRRANPIPFWQYWDLASLSSSDLIVVEASRHLTSKLPRQNAFVTPEGVEHILNVSGDWQTVKSRFRANLRKNTLPRLVRQGYEFEATNDSKDFEYFYHQMYLPTTSNQHGERSNPVSHNEAHLYFKYGFLLKVKRQGEWVGGVVCQPEAKTLLWRIVGVKDGERHLLDENVSYMNFYGAILWANENGYQTINFMGTEPLLGEGLFHHKRKWGSTVRLSPNEHRRLWFKIQRLTPAVSQFLKANPSVIVNDDGTLNGMVVIDDSEGVSPEIRRVWDSRYMTPGLRSLIIRPTRSFEKPNISELVILAPPVNQAQS